MNAGLATGVPDMQLNNSYYLCNSRFSHAQLELRAPRMQQFVIFVRFVANEAHKRR